MCHVTLVPLAVLQAGPSGGWVERHAPMSLALTLFGNSRCVRAPSTLLANARISCNSRSGDINWMCKKLLSLSCENHTSACRMEQEGRKTLQSFLSTATSECVCLPSVVWTVLLFVGAHVGGWLGAKCEMKTDFFPPLWPSRDAVWGGGTVIVIACFPTVNIF